MPLPKLATPSLPPHLPANPHHPPHLREVCAILARGVVRLRDRNQRQQSRQVSDAIGESSLHFLPDQRGHAKPKRRPA